MKGRLKGAGEVLGWGRTTLRHGQKNPFSVITGSRYVPGVRRHGLLLTLSVFLNKGRRLIKLVEVTRNPLTFVALSAPVLCHLQRALSVLRSLMQFSTLPIHPFTV